MTGQTKDLAAECFARCSLHPLSSTSYCSQISIVHNCHHCHQCKFLPFVICEHLWQLSFVNNNNLRGQNLLPDFAKCGGGQRVVEAPPRWRLSMRSPSGATSIPRISAQPVFLRLQIHKSYVLAWTRFWWAKWASLVMTSQPLTSAVAADAYREKVGVLHHLAEGRVAGEKLDDGIGVEEVTLTIHRGCASGKPPDPLAVSDALPPARSRNGAALLRHPRQARRLSATAENERTERQCSAAFRQVVESLFLAPRMAFSSSFFVQGHNTPVENNVHYTKSCRRTQWGLKNKKLADAKKLLKLCGTDGGGTPSTWSID